MTPLSGGSGRPPLAWQRASPRSGFRSTALLVAALVMIGGGEPRTQAPTAPVRPVPALADASRALSSGNSTRALAIARAYLSKRPDDPAARVVIARVHISRDELAAAHDQLQRALRAAPRNVDVLYYLGLVSGRMAHAEFQRLFAMAPGSSRVHHLMAESLEAQDRRAEAEAEYEAALKVKPDLVDALLGLARLKRIRLDCETATTLYREAEAIRPTFDGAHGLGTCYLRAENDAAALSQFELAVARDPGVALAWVGAASALLRLGRTADAIARLRRAIELEPRMRDAYYMLGRAYQSAGDKTRAQDAFSKAEALRVDPIPPEHP